jgi:hypothetical protein
VLNGVVPESGFPSASDAVNFRVEDAAWPLTSGVVSASVTLLATGRSVAVTSATPLTATGTGIEAVERMLPCSFGWSKKLMIKPVALACATTAISQIVTPPVSVQAAGSGERSS